MNSSGRRKGDDIQAFVTCILSGGPNCDCTDFNSRGAPDIGDVSGFVSALLSAPACP